MCLCTNLSKIHSAAQSQQLLHALRAYFSPTLCISIVINSRQPYAFSHLSLTTYCILPTQDNTEVFKLMWSVTELHLTLNTVARWSYCKFCDEMYRWTALYVQMTCPCCSDMINKARNVLFLPDCHCQLDIWQPMAKGGPTRWTGACSCPRGKAWRCVAAGPWAPLALVHL